MPPILYRPMVKEALILIISGAVATMICSRVYAATAGDIGQPAPAVSAQAQTSLPGAAPVAAR